MCEGFKLAGRLLNYPECCIEYFCSNFSFGPVKISHNGFIPCEEHAKLTREELETLVGHKFEKEPAVVAAWWKLEHYDDYDAGLAVYRAAGLEDFFKRCWDLTFEQGVV